MKIDVVLVGAALAACTDVPSQKVAGPTMVQLTRSAATPPFPTLDDEFAAIARVEPSFGGIFLDSMHVPVIVLTDVTRLAAVRAAGADASLAKRRLALGNVRVRTAAYGFALLKQWLDSAEANWNGPGLVFAGIDEMHNRLHVGVETAGVQINALMQLVRLGIPDRAVAVDVVPRPKSLAGSMLTDTALTDSVRPLRGGLYIYNSPSSNRCTLGFLAHTNGSPLDSIFFFTNSHCSAVEDGIDPPGSQYYQPGEGAPYIGSEIGDRTPSQNSRFSDASRNLVDPSAQPDRIGRIANTNMHGTTLVPPHLWVTSEAAPPMQGEVIFKVGYKTGLTTATVTDPCLDTHRAGVTLLCQARAWSVRSDTITNGDSGSPIFQDIDDSTVALTGLLWGGDDPNHQVWWLSPLNNIKCDLGDFSVVAWAQPLVTLNGPSNVGPGTATWTASASGGNGSYTYQWQYQDAGLSTWNSLGTGQSQVRHVDQSTPSFTVKVTVTSGGYSRSSAIAVTVYSPLTSVSLSGPSWVHPGVTCSWIASPDGGVPPFTYEWQGGSVVGSDTYSTYVSDHFWVDVTVTDGNGGQASTSQEVFVDEGGPGC